MEWTDSFPDLKALPQDTLALLRRTSRVVSLPSGTVVFGPGQPPQSYLLLLSGTVRVRQVSESGREIVLYRVAAGESCAMTTACLMGDDLYQAEGIAETPITAAVIPRATFDEAIAGSAAFRRFVFAALSNRMTALFKLIEEVAFSRIDIRLAQRLVELAGADGRVAMTHQQLASELGTAREVISRQLLEFQRRGWLTTARGELTLTNTDALRSLCAVH
jgi:CRP/FNR family transcriptional regulator